MKVIISVIRLNLPILGMKQVILDTLISYPQHGNSHIMAFIRHFLKLPKRFFRINRLPPYSRPSDFQDDTLILLPGDQVESHEETPADPSLGFGRFALGRAVWSVGKGGH
jgi:hypothetical protein